MDFNNSCATSFAADPRKRVNYTYGLVLGVGEFQTEQGYFLEKHRSHARSLHGYGTVSGLAVSVRDTVNGPEIRVSPGLAIDPNGREICVPEPQCALIDNWLLQQQQSGDFPPPLDGSPPDLFAAYVTLCYRQCLTDKVPVPVGPCHSLDKSSVASRIQDSFELSLTTTPPLQAEESAETYLADILARVTVGAGPGALTTPDALIAEILSLIPDQSPPAGLGSIPAEYLLHPLYAEDILRDALRVFVTEVRPLLASEGGGCLQGPGGSPCVLLARLTFAVSGFQVTGPVLIEQNERPILVQTRLLQELTERLLLRENAGLPQNFVVAAGQLRGNMTTVGPVLNNLRIASVSSGEIVVTFDGYRQPDGSFQYIVNAVGVAAPPRTPIPTVRFLQFRPEGFALRVTRGGVSISVPDLAQIPFMIEVSRIG